MVKAGRKKWILKIHFQNLKKNKKNIILLSTPSCQSFSDYLLMTMQWLRLFCETAGTLNIYISYEHLTFCSCNTSKKKLCASFLFLKLMTTNYAHLLAKLNLKTYQTNFKCSVCRQIWGLFEKGGIKRISPWL